MQGDASASSTARPRLGHIDFLNGLPLYDGLMRSGALLDVHLRRETPDVLNILLLSGKLDIGPISLVPALQHSDELVILADLAIGSDGPMHSAILVSKVPIEQLDGAHIALGSTGRTAVLLTQMLLSQRFNLSTSFSLVAPDLEHMLSQADAAVLIGDAALRASHDAAARGLHVLDLGAAWRDWTGLPMVFAVWAVRREYVDQHPERVAVVQRALASALAASLERVDDVAEQASRWEPFDAPTLSRYFQSLDFRLGHRQMEGIGRFARLAAVQGAVPEGAELRLRTLLSR